MNAYSVRLNSGIGPVALGALRDEVRALLRQKPVEVPRRLLVLPMDFFAAAGLQVEYGTDSRVVSVQATSAAVCDLDGRVITGRPFSEIRRWLEQLDPAAEFDGASLTSNALNLAVYSGAAAKDPDAPVEAVMVFVPRYYEKAARREL